METDVILPDLQAPFFARTSAAKYQWHADSRGRAQCDPAPALPIQLYEALYWTLWCSRHGQNFGKNRGLSRGCTTGHPQAEVEFVLKEMEGHATNVHYFGGIQLSPIWIASR